MYAGDSPLCCSEILSRSVLVREHRALCGWHVGCFPRFGGFGGGGHVSPRRGEKAAVSPASSLKRAMCMAASMNLIAALGEALAIFGAGAAIREYTLSSTSRARANFWKIFRNLVREGRHPASWPNTCNAVCEITKHPKPFGHRHDTVPGSQTQLQNGKPNPR